jgi:hypothetical protein
MKRRVLKPALPLVGLLLLASLAHLAHGKTTTPGRAAQAQSALDRYLAAGESTQLAAASVEIHASLNRYEETGEARAIRTAAASGRCRYQLLEFSGDPRVKEQLIARYLNARGLIVQMPQASIAVTPANYTFTYKGVMEDDEREPAYVFGITPRRKGDGLIRGEIWLDQKTGAPIRQSGYLVKYPSGSVGRVTVNQEDAFRDGAIELRRIDIKVEGHRLGRAELVIEERPLPPGANVCAPEKGGRP